MLLPQYYLAYIYSSNYLSVSEFKWYFFDTETVRGSQILKFSVIVADTDNVTIMFLTNGLRDNLTLQ